MGAAVIAVNDHEFSEVLKLVRDRFDSLDGRMDRQDRALAGLLVEVKHTNSRVTKLELKEAAVEAASGEVAEIARETSARHHAWRVTIISGVVAAIVGGGLSSLILILGSH